MTGKIISHYKVLEKLGGGGMGVVYKAEDTKLDRYVALKFLPPSFSSEDEAKQRFIHEAKAASTLQHHNICTLHEIDEVDSQLFICMDYYEGETLRNKIEHGQLTIEETIKIAAQIAEGLSKAHENNIIHRDIKPANIFISTDGIVKILDFGLAKIIGQTKISKPGSTSGTVAYMSPQQARGESVDHQSDIWSFGVVLYEMITGQNPFKAEYEQAVIHSIFNKEPESIKNLRKDVPEKLDWIIRKALEKNPTDRYRSIDEMLSDLRIFLKDGETTNKIKRPKAKKKKLVQVTVAILFALAITYVFYFHSTQKPSYDSIAVLPFQNLTGEQGKEYIIDGMTDGLINEFMKINSLRVISRSSMMTYKDAPKPLKDIARELNVDVLVEGVFHRLDDKIKIMVKLIQPEPEDRIWGDEYEVAIDDIPILQGNIAQIIASKINIELTRQEEKRFRNIQKVNPDAYERYLLARYHMNNFRFSNAVEEFKNVLEIDSTYAPAYSGLAGGYIGLVHWGDLEPGDAEADAKRFALKAISLDSNIVEAQATLGDIYLYFDWNFSRAEKHITKALSLNPNNEFAIHRAGSFFIYYGKFSEGISFRQRYQELNPLSFFSHFGLGWAYWYSRNYDKALPELKKALEMNPDNIEANCWLALTYSHLGDHTEALNIVREQKLYEKRYPGIGISSQIYALAGLRKEALELVDRMDQPIFDYEIALTYSILGNKDEAFEWLEKCYQRHGTNMLGLKIEPDFDPIRSDPRFQDLLKRVGFVDNKME